MPSACELLSPISFDILQDLLPKDHVAIPFCALVMRICVHIAMHYLCGKVFD